MEEENVSESFGKCISEDHKRDQVAKVIVKEVGCQSMEALVDNYPDKFTAEILDRYHGAITEGKCKNETDED